LLASRRRFAEIQIPLAPERGGRNRATHRESSRTLEKVEFYDELGSVELTTMAALPPLKQGEARDRSRLYPKALGGLEAAVGDLCRWRPAQRLWRR
jgi:hypothetical protein